jgi:hypothetical protein
VPAARLGRVNAVIHVVEWGPLPVGSLLGGALGQLLGLRPALVVLAGAGAVGALPWVLAPAIRDRFVALERGA